MTDLEKCYRLLKNTPKEERIKIIEKNKTDDPFWDELLKMINNGTSNRND